MEQLARAFADAPGRERGWDRALLRLAQATGSSGGQLIGIGGPALIPFNLAARNAAGTTEALVATEARARASRCTPPAIVGSARIEVPAWPKGGGFQAAPGVRSAFGSSDGRLTGVALLRTSEDGPPCAAQHSALAGAAPHVLNAIRAQKALEARAAALIARTLEATGFAAFVLDAAGALRAMTPSARAELASEAAFRLHHRRLMTVHAGDQPRFDAAIAEALAGVGDRSGGAILALGTPSGDRSTVVTVVSRRAGGLGSLSHLPHVLILLRGSASAVPPNAVLRQLFGLTRSEAAVAIRIANGLSRDEVAAERGVAATTVQAQLKAIFAKVGVNRELSLAVKVRGLMGM